MSTIDFNETDWSGESIRFVTKEEIEREHIRQQVREEIAQEIRDYMKEEAGSGSYRLGLMNGLAVSLRIVEGEKS